MSLHFFEPITRRSKVQILPPLFFFSSKVRRLIFCGRHPAARLLRARRRQIAVHYQLRHLPLIDLQDETQVRFFTACSDNLHKGGQMHGCDQIMVLVTSCSLIDSSSHYNHTKFLFSLQPIYRRDCTIRQEINRIGLPFLSFMDILL